MSITMPAVASERFFAERTAKTLVRMSYSGCPGFCLARKGKYLQEQTHCNDRLISFCVVSDHLPHRPVCVDADETAQEAPEGPGLIPNTRPSHCLGVVCIQLTLVTANEMQSAAGDKQPCAKPELASGRRFKQRTSPAAAFSKHKSQASSITSLILIKLKGQQQVLNSRAHSATAVYEHTACSLGWGELDPSPERTLERGEMSSRQNAPRRLRARIFQPRASWQLFRVPDTILTICTGELSPFDCFDSFY